MTDKSGLTLSIIQILASILMIVYSMLIAFGQEDTDLFNFSIYGIIFLTFGIVFLVKASRR